MKSIYHDIDPEGDLIIVLKDPNTQRIVPDVSLRPRAASANREFKLDDTVVNLPEMPSGLPTDEVGDDESPIEVRFRVSARHMTFASVVFKKMLSASWKESKPVDSQSVSGGPDTAASIVSSSAAPDDPSPVSSTASSPPASDTPPIHEISATGWNAHALLNVLNVIHGKYSETPREVSLEFFLDVAVIANYYQCAEALGFAAELWWRTGSSFKKGSYGKRAIMALFIAWVFDRSELFACAASTVIEYGQGLNHVETYDLPIAAILEKLNEKRNKGIRSLLHELKDIEQKLEDNKIGCSHKCRSMMFGSLHFEIRESDDLKCTEPDYNGVTLASIRDKINDFRPIEWWVGPSRVTAHQCSPKKLMEPLIKTIREDINSLKLSDFQK